VFLQYLALAGDQCTGQESFVSSSRDS